MLKSIYSYSHLFTQRAITKAFPINSTETFPINSTKAFPINSAIIPLSGRASGASASTGGACRCWRRATSPPASAWRWGPPSSCCRCSGGGAARAAAGALRPLKTTPSKANKWAALTKANIFFKENKPRSAWNQLWMFHRQQNKWYPQRCQENCSQLQHSVIKFDRSNKFDFCYYGQVNSLRLKLSVASKWASKHLWGTIYFAGDGTMSISWQVFYKTGWISGYFVVYDWIKNNAVLLICQYAYQRQLFVRIYREYIVCVYTVKLCV